MQSVSAARAPRARRRINRASMRLATLAQAMMRTMAATPEVHSRTFASRLGSGPAAVFTSPASARGRTSESGSTRGLIARASARLLTYAPVSSASAIAVVTPGARRTSTSVQSHW